MKKADIIICGVPRDKDRMKQTILEMTGLRNEGYVENIIFSTWKNYLTDDYREILDGSTILEKDEPEDRGVRGHIWCQMKSFENGLNECNKENYVLKIRTDLYICPYFVKSLISKAENYLYRNYKEGDIFIEKVWIPYVEITKPFYMPDEIFFGNHNDISLLYNYDKSYDDLAGKDGGGETHIRRFIYPFIDKYPILYDYIEEIRQDNCTILNSPKRFERLVDNLNRSKYIKYLSIYYKILYEYFRIWNEIGKMSWYQLYCQPVIQLENDRFIENFHSSKCFLGQRIFCYDDKWIYNIMERRIEHPKAIEIYNISRS